MVGPEGLVGGVGVEGAEEEVEFYWGGFWVREGVGWERGEEPAVRAFCWSVGVADFSVRRRGRSLLRLCQAEKLDRLVSIIRVV